MYLTTSLVSSIQAKCKPFRQIDIKYSAVFHVFSSLFHAYILQYSEGPNEKNQQQKSISNNWLFKLYLKYISVD